MEDELPITITASQELLSRYKKLSGVVNKQEALVNFQTLSAGWYEDEGNIISIHIELVYIDEYQQKIENKNSGNKIEIADDVIMYVSNKKVGCLVAITESETNLLDKKPNVLSGYITMKVKKVINEIAEKQGLLTLPV